MKTERLIAISSGIHLLMLFPVLPDWVKVIAMGGWSLGMIAIERRRPWSATLMQFFAGVGFVATFAVVRPVFGVENSACLAAWVLAFQIHHLETARARLTQLIVCLFALAIYLANDANTFNLGVMLADLVFFFALLNASQGARSSPFRWSTLRSAVKLVALSFPVWIMIFFFFPRFTLSLWGNPAAATAKSGFADEIRPGLIGKVVQRDEIAFRFRYLVPPDQKIFYFRGGVLNEIRGGLYWARGGTQSFPLDDVVNADFGFLHEVWLEPRWQRSLFAGEFAQAVLPGYGLGPRDVEPLGASVFRFRFTPRQLTYYQVSSTRVDLAQGISREERRATTSLPEDVEADLKRVQDPPKLAGLPASRAVETLNRWFQERRFRYSQEVPTVPGERLSAFLNEVRVGFCEHYAASAAVLLRGAGIPARVVIGFLGGTYNPIADSYTMLDRDAHAWTEYFDDESARWVRYDPTAVIQPLRFSIGSEIYRLTPEELDEAARGDRVLDWRGRLQESLGLVWDAWTHELERRIVFYDAGWLTRTFEDLGIPRWGPWLTGLAALVTGLVLLTLLRGAFRVRTKKSASERLWQSVRAEYRVPDSLQGETAVFEAIARAAGPSASAVVQFKDHLLLHRYGAPQGGRPTTRELRREWRELKRQLAKDGTRERIRWAPVLKEGRPKSRQSASTGATMARHTNPS